MKRITFLKSLFLLFALVVGSGNVWADNVTFNRVTEAPTDWSGEYLIVSEKQPTMAYDGSKTGTNLGTNGDLFIVTANASTITGDYSAKTFIIAKSSTDGKYTIKSKSGYYIGRTSNYNGLDQSTTTTYDNTISISNSLVTITSSAGPKLQFYNSSGSYTFKYYKSAQSAIRLYKIEETTTTHSLTFSAIGGTITATNATTSAAVASESQVAEGATLNITAVPNPGYIFTGWTSSPAATFGDASSASTTYVMPTADAILTANFEADEKYYEINLNQTTGGMIAASTSTAQSGTEIELTPTPSSGYRFVSWTVLDEDLNEVVVTNNKFTMPASNVEIEGTFAQEYAITINSAENGSIAASPTAGIAGETITLTATPAANYALNTVTVTDADAGNVEVSGTGNTRTFTMPAKAVTVTATFDIAKGSILAPYTVEEIEALTENISDVYVTGYIVGCVDGNNSKAYKTTKTQWNTANLLLADTPDKSFTEGYIIGTNTADGLIPVALPTKDMKDNWGISSTSGAVIGYKILLKGNEESYFTGRGVKSTSEINAITAPATISSAEYATFVNATNALDFSGTGVNVYTARDMGSYVKLNVISSGQVPANTPVVLYKAGGGNVNVPVIASADPVGTNDLCVSTGSDVENMFVLAKKNNIVGFYKWAGSTSLSADKVYLQGQATSSARDYLAFDNTATGINNVEIKDEFDENIPMYNLAGQRVNKSYKGVVIVNGKKVVRK